LSQPEVTSERGKALNLGDELRQITERLRPKVDQEPQRRQELNRVTEQDNQTYDLIVSSLPERLRAVASKNKTALLILEGNARGVRPDEYVKTWARSEHRYKSVFEIADEIFTDRPSAPLKRLIRHSKSLGLYTDVVISRNRYYLFVSWYPNGFGDGILKEEADGRKADISD
jgi:hypothetical protein